MNYLDKFFDSRERMEIKKMNLEKKSEKSPSPIQKGLESYYSKRINRFFKIRNGEGSYLPRRKFTKKLNRFTLTDLINEYREIKRRYF